MKHKCDNCEHKYINNSGSGICLMFNSYEQACEAYNAETCPYAEPKMTNFDRIKAMSVEEMAEMLYEEMENTMCYCDFCKHYKLHAPHCSAPDIKQGCLNAIKKYLESEVQGDDSK